MVTIRTAIPEDLGVITDIYNQAILASVDTFDIEPKTVKEQKEWFDSHGSKYPLLVALQDGVIVGWASLNEWSARYGYSETAEISCYVSKESRGKGIGGKLSKAIVRAGQEAGFHTLIARVAEGNTVSVHVTESLGFRHIGIMKEVGHKFGRRLDVHLMQKIFDRPGS